MGAASSSISELKDNELLRRFAGKEPIQTEDLFWNQLLSFPLTPLRSRDDDRLLEESTASLCRALLNNNLTTRNFGALLRVFLLRAAELKDPTKCNNRVFTWQTYNALFILRCICKYFIETISEENVVRQFQTAAEDGDGDSGDAPLLELFQNALVEVIVDVPIIAPTVSLHLEAINTLLVLLSVQMFLQKPASKSVIFRSMMSGKCSIHACLLMKTLLRHYMLQEKYTSSFQDQGGGSIILGLASGLWSVLTLGYGRPAPTPDEPIIARQSLFLILILSNHCTADRSLPNPYRTALCSFSNASSESGAGAPTQAVATFKLDYSGLYGTLCQTLRDDQTTLLLYLLLHRNQDFRTFLLVRADIEELILPLLKILYDAQDRNSHHIYMALIILLIFSEDDLFNKAVHDVMLKNVTWYTERNLSSISLGGLLVLVVIRTIQYNMTQMRDKYLHTNCLAALANMSSHFKGLHPYVTQRIVSLFENLSRRHARLSEQLRTTTEPLDETADVAQDVYVLEEVVRMVLEIINACLTSQLSHNQNLVYTLLYQRHLFQQFRTHPTFQDVIQNIETVLTYFSHRVESAGDDLTVNNVLSIIQQGALQWSPDRLKKFPDLKFKYVEEEQPEEFFLPYIWSLVYQSADMFWNPNTVRLFCPQPSDVTII